MKEAFRLRLPVTVAQLIRSIHESPIYLDALSKICVVNFARGAASLLPQLAIEQNIHE